MCAAGPCVHRADSGCLATGGHRVCYWEQPGRGQRTVSARTTLHSIVCMCVCAYACVRVCVRACAWTPTNKGYEIQGNCMPWNLLACMITGDSLEVYMPSPSHSCDHLQRLLTSWNQRQRWPLLLPSLDSKHLRSIPVHLCCDPCCSVETLELHLWSHCILLR